jgi:hypothetical protein
MKLLFLAFGLLWLAPPPDALAQRDNPPKKPESADKEQTPDKPRRRRVVSDLSGFDLLDQGKVKKESMVVGAARGFAPPVAMAPKLGRVYGDRPTFEWRDAARPSAFVVILTDESQEEIHKAQTEKTLWSYPPDAPRLEPGRTYFWTVQAASGLGAEPSPPAGFLVLSGPQRQEIDNALAAITAADPYDQLHARARVFTDHRLWYDAVAAYAELIARFPSRPEPYEERATIYAQLDATQPLADEDFAKAEKVKGPIR